MNLNGKWLVTAKSGLKMRALMWGLGRNVKHIAGGNGYNVSDNLGEWGHFAVNYEGDDNWKLIYKDAPIVDTLKKVNDRTLTGKFYLAGKFIGKFKMERLVI